MNDIEFAHGVSPNLGDLYERAAKYGVSAPGYALTLLRSFAETVCETLDPNMDRGKKLERKIARMRDTGLVDHTVLAPLRILQKHGNIAAHPKAFSFTTHDYAQMLKEALPAALKLLEHLYGLNSVDGEAPRYTVTLPTRDNLQLISYQAVFEEDADARHMLGIYFKEKADGLRATESMFRADDGYGFDSRKFIDQANHWFKLAAHDWHVEALYEYGVYLARLQGEDFHDQRKEGERYVWQASEKGHVDASAFIGDCYFWGSALYEQDLDAARGLYQQAASQSHPEAIAQLGAMHEQGLGGPVDFDAAFQCSLQAAEAGFPRAQFHLYSLHNQGHAFPDDSPKAIAWLAEAADQKHPEAMLELAGLIMQKIIPGRTSIDARALYEQCGHIQETQIRAWYRLAHLLAKQTNDLDALQRALSCLTNCQDAIVSTSQHRDLLPGCDRLTPLLWEQINVTINRAHPQLARAAAIVSRRPYTGTPVGRNEPCPCGLNKKYKHCCLQ
ncbi:SEC-C metal-binding domain-containing protein [Pseudomonas sp. W5-01]|uniref:tetratricopeptide repeat protein n=1 Tax=Pseudomonas sp. W5-01 TaxID=3097454 RepID=UPI00397BBF69